MVFEAIDTNNIWLFQYNFEMRNHFSVKIPEQSLFVLPLGSTYVISINMRLSLCILSMYEVIKLIQQLHEIQIFELLEKLSLSLTVTDKLLVCKLSYLQ